MLSRLTVAVLILSTATFSGAGIQSDADVYVYVAEEARDCILDFMAYDGLVYTVYVYSGDFAAVTGVDFRVESERFGPENVQSVTTPANVSITGGDIFSGITLSFPTRRLDHEPVLFIEVDGHSDTWGNILTHDVVLMNGGVSVPARDMLSIGYPFDCFASSTVWFPPDTVNVAVDRDVSFSFDAFVSTGGYPPNGQVQVVDGQGWVADAFSQDVNAGCGECPWDWTTVFVPVHVPKGTADGTLNEITLQMYTFGDVLDERTVILRAVEGVAIEETTWGRVKALYQ